MTKKSTSKKSAFIQSANEARQEAIIRLTDDMTIISDQLNAIEAIVDAARVLTALERAPAHHDTHPSHNILTGGGYAHGIRVANDTLPALLHHARTLVQITHNDCGCMQEEAIDALRKLGESDGG